MQARTLKSRSTVQTLLWKTQLEVQRIRKSVLQHEDSQNDKPVLGQSCRPDVLETVSYYRLHIPKSEEYFIFFLSQDFDVSTYGEYPKMNWNSMDAALMNRVLESHGETGASLASYAFRMAIALDAKAKISYGSHPRTLMIHHASSLSNEEVAKDCCGGNYGWELVHYAAKSSPGCTALVFLPVSKTHSKTEPQLSI